MSEQKAAEMPQDIAPDGRRSVTPGHPTREGAGYDCGCGECWPRPLKPRDTDRRILTGYRDGTSIQPGDVALDLADGSILSRRDGYWVDGGFAPGVENYYSGDETSDVTVPLLRIEDERVDGPLQLLYRPSADSNGGSDA